MSAVLADLKAQKARIWNGWTRNYIVQEGGYITHAFEEGKGDRGLCGVRIDDGSFLNMLDDWEPGCMRCRAILRKRGLIEQP